MFGFCVHCADLPGDGPWARVTLDANSTSMTTAAQASRQNITLRSEPFHGIAIARDVGIGALNAEWHSTCQLGYRCADCSKTDRYIAESSSVVRILIQMLTTSSVVDLELSK